MKWRRGYGKTFLMNIVAENETKIVRFESEIQSVLNGILLYRFSERKEIKPNSSLHKGISSTL